MGSEEGLGLGARDGLRVATIILTAEVSTVRVSTPRVVEVVDSNEGSEMMEVTADVNTEDPVAVSSTVPCSSSMAESGADATNDTSHT